MSRYVDYVPSYLRGRLHLVTDTDAENEFDNATKMTLEHQPNTSDGIF